MEIYVDKKEWEERIKKCIEKWYDSNSKYLLKQIDLDKLAEILMDEFFEN